MCLRTTILNSKAPAPAMASSVEAGVVMARTLVSHLARVLRGDAVRLDATRSTPTGRPADPLAEAVCLACFALCMFVACRVLQATLFAALAHMVRTQLAPAPHCELPVHSRRLPCVRWWGAVLLRILLDG
jgi:hypothetical protein